MARKDGSSLANAFDEFEGNNSAFDQTPEDSAPESDVNPPAVVTSEVPAPETKTIREVTNNLIQMYDQKSKKKTVEETHNRATFLFRKDLQQRLDKLAEGKRGFKTMFMNKAIEALLDELEDAQKLK